MGRRSRTAKEKANSEHSEFEDDHSVFDMSHYTGGKKFKKKNYSVYDKIAKTKSTKSKNWI